MPYTLFPIPDSLFPSLFIMQINYHLDFTQVLLAATFLLGIVAVLDFLARKLSAAFRHGIWAAAMFAILVIPFALPCLPPLMVFETSDASVLDAAWNRLVTPSVTPQTEPDKSDVPEVITPLSASQHSMTPQTLFPTPSPPKEGQKAVAQYGGLTVWSSGDTWVVAAFAVFSAVVLLVGLLRVAGIFVSHRNAARWIREASPVSDPNLLTLCREMVQKFRISRSVDLKEHPKAEVPLVVSIRKPTVILPVRFGELPSEEQQAVLVHELAHIARRDLFWQLVTQWASVFYWYHPLYWYARHRMRLERESACDDMVLQNGGDANQYASVLLEMTAPPALKLFERKLSESAVPFARVKTVDRRISGILTPNLNRRSLGRAGMGGLVFAFTILITLGGMALQRPSEAQRLYAISVPDKDRKEKVKIHGRVVMPDGTPPKECYVAMTSSVFFTDSSIFSPFKNFCGSSGSNGDQRLDDGKPFEFEVHVGSNVLLTTGTTDGLVVGNYGRHFRGGTEGPEVFVAQPYAFLAGKKNDEIVLQLEKATLVTGKLRYDNGGPAFKERIGASQFVPAARGADIPRVRNSSVAGSGAIANENGDFEFHLWPGEFTLSAGGTPWAEPVTKTIFVEQGKPLEIDLTIPTPLRINVVMPDGSAAGNFWMRQLTAYRPLWNQTGKFYPEVLIQTLYEVRRYWDSKPEGPDFVVPDRPIVMNLCREENYVTVMTEDNEYGIVQKIGPELMGQELTLTLRPTVSGTVKLLDTTKRPIAEQEVSVLIRIIKIERNGDYVVRTGPLGQNLHFRTDTEGRLDFKVPQFVGDGDSIMFCFEKGRNTGDGSSGQMSRSGSWFRRSDTEERFKEQYKMFRPVTNGQPFDLGTMEVER